MPSFDQGISSWQYLLKFIVNHLLDLHKHWQRWKVQAPLLPQPLRRKELPKNQKHQPMADKGLSWVPWQILVGLSNEAVQFILLSMAKQLQPVMITTKKIDDLKFYFWSGQTVILLALLHYWLCQLSQWHFVENEAGRTNPKTADQEQPEDKTEDGQGRQPNTWSLDEMDDEWLPNEDL